MPPWVFYLMIACLGRGRLFAGKKCCVEPYASKLTTALASLANHICVALQHKVVEPVPSPDHKSKKLS
jgi:hypothetical protein